MAPSSTSARVGSYVLGTKLETGRTYEIWQSQHVDRKFGTRELLVKKLLPELAGNPRLVEQCVLRAERAKRLHHEGISEVVDVFIEEGQCCIVTEYLAGFCLRDVIDRVRSCDNALPVWFSLQVARQISRALEYAHQLPEDAESPGPVYHQDVTPQNIFITSLGQVKLLDFGYSRAALLGTNVASERTTSDSGEFDLLAPHYGDVHLDIMGLARSLYEMLAGVPMGQRFVAPSKHAPWVTPELDHLLARALGLPGPDRFSTMHELRVALADLIRRQRHQAEGAHLSGLLRVVMASCRPQPLESSPIPDPDSLDDADVRITAQPEPPRSPTILPGAACESETVDWKLERNGSSLPSAESDRNLDDAAFDRITEAFQPPLSQRPGNSRHSWDAAIGRASEDIRSAPSHPAEAARHGWDAALDRIRRESEPPPAIPPASERRPSRPSRSIPPPAPPSFGQVRSEATISFERGLELLRAGDAAAAKAAWERALELDPNHRLSQVNLNLLRKRRDSEWPPPTE
ncbi:MAG TPA: protein kinase [Polyangiaceae bacterium]|nr:protein kinase [Polyangiaceae bacterium]